MKSQVKNAFVICSVLALGQFIWRWDRIVSNYKQEPITLEMTTEPPIDDVIDIDVDRILEDYPNVRPNYWNKSFHNDHEFLNHIVPWHTSAKHKVLLYPTVSFSSNTFRVLLAIKSTTPDYQLRCLVRRTWLSNEAWDYKVAINGTERQVEVQHVFLFGLRDEDDYEKLKSENDKFHDILLGEFVDSFQTLAIKEHLFLNFLNDLGTDSIDYIYKGDTDVLVNPPMLIEQMLLTAEKQREFICGCRSVGVLPFRDMMSKYFVPEELWPANKTYEPYVSGGGFILTAGLARQMIEVKDSVTIFPIDDAYLGSIVNLATDRFK